MRWLFVLLLLHPGLPVRAQSQAAAAPRSERKTDVRTLRFSSHALQRMTQRGVSRERVERLVAATEPFRYFHQGQWKLGYFDPPSGLFVATAGGVVITVFTDATPKYVERLKRAKP